MKKILLLAFIIIGNIAIAQDSLNMRTVGIWPYGIYHDMEYAKINGQKFIFIASGGGILVVNVEDPAAPEVVDKYPTNSRVKDIKIVGKYAYVANGESGIKIFNISNPGNIKLIGQSKVKFEAHCIEVIKNTAYVADGDSGVSIFDIKKKANPTIIGWLPSNTPARYLKVIKNNLYVGHENTTIHFIIGFTDKKGGIAKYDIKKPQKPKFIKYTEIGVEENNTFSYFRDNITVMSVWGSYVYNAVRDTFVTLNAPDFKTMMCESAVFDDKGAGIASLDGNCWRTVIKDSTISFTDSLFGNLKAKGIYGKNGIFYSGGEMFATYDIKTNTVWYSDIGFPSATTYVAVDSNMVWQTTDKIVQSFDIAKTNTSWFSAGKNLKIEKRDFWPFRIVASKNNAYLSMWDRDKNIKVVEQKDSELIEREIQGTNGWDLSKIQDSIAVAINAADKLHVCSLSSDSQIKSRSIIERKNSSWPCAIDENLLFITVSTHGADSLVCYDIKDMGIVAIQPLTFR